MDKRITFRFYKVTRDPKSKVALADALQEIGNIDGAKAREKHLGTDFYARAEVIMPHKGSIVGDMTRIQKTNLPAEIVGDERRPLRGKNPLGHSIVFRYLPGSGDLGIQYDPRILSPKRFMQYVGATVDNALFRLNPIVREDMWERFKEAPVRKLAIAIASPTNLESVDKGDAAAALTSFRNMGEAYDSPQITIEMSMGRKSGALSESIKGLVRHIRASVVKEQVDVARMKARIVDEDDKSQDIDLLEDILSVKEELPLKDNDPDANYEIKIEALRKAMNEFIG